jgi:hypothetical protein
MEVRMTNQTDEQTREIARHNYQNHPTWALESVIRVNPGTRIREQQIVREVAQEILNQRQT